MIIFWGVVDIWDFREEQKAFSSLELSLVKSELIKFSLQKYTDYIIHKCIPFSTNCMVQSAVAAEYTDWISAEG